MILYSSPVSSYTAKVRLVIALKNREADIAIQLPPGGLYSDEYRAIVPMGKIPALVDGDLVLSESEIIAEYLEEVFPQPALLPADPKMRARSRFFSRFHDLYLEPPVRNLFPQVPERNRQEAVVETNMARIRRELQRFSEMSQPQKYLLGDQLTLADCAYPSTLMYLDLISAAMGYKIEYPPEIQRWRENILAHPAIAGVMAEHHDTGRDWLQKRLQV